MTFYIIILLLLVLLLLVMFAHKDTTLIQESWVNWQQNPFGNYYTATDDPVSFYTKPIYRLPYMYPVCHMVNYPVNHCKTLSD